MRKSSLPTLQISHGIRVMLRNHISHKRCKDKGTNMDGKNDQEHNKEIKNGK